MGFAFNELNWTPETFWRSSLAEIMAAIRFANGDAQNASGPKPMSGNRLKELMERYPDGN